MFRAKAIEAAKIVAKREGETAYVVYDITRDENVPARSYWPATLEDTETFYAGCPIDVAIEPDGSWR